jgi:hypothetical protein
MWSDYLGDRFQPGIEENDGGGGNELQEAVQLLNLRLPTVVGAKSPISQQLLSAAGLEGQPETAAMIQHWRRLLGLAGPPPRIVDDPTQSKLPLVATKPAPPPRFVVDKPIPPGTVRPDPLTPTRERVRPERPYIGDQSRRNLG